ncbi:MAG: protein phosphatase 2C domain-containing protein [Candidatus Polarisedimenticolaceae bacterium]|nr:protein phosphatase 2C domain-containing protein [Candidatus Polarisedimenticolaceae bacterium]
MKEFLCESAQHSRLGNRDNNEDRHLILQSPDATLIAVADGMGGHPKGEMAAQILIDTCHEELKNSEPPVTQPKSFIKNLFLTAHSNIVEYGLQHEPTIHPRSTGVACLIQNDQAIWGHIGDSRLYLIRNGLIYQRTKDHSYIQRLKNQGMITEAEGDRHPNRNYVTRCLGGSETPPRVTISDPFTLEEGDILLLCSDGFWGQMDEKLTIQTLSNESILLDDALERLTKLAEKMAIPNSDNVTAIALRWRHKEKTKIVSRSNGEGSDDEIDNAIDILRQAINHHDLEKF